MFSLTQIINIFSFTDPLLDILNQITQTTVLTGFTVRDFFLWWEGPGRLGLCAMKKIGEEYKL